MDTSNPAHVAIIMDGNGRWAELRRKNRTFGHLRGARVAREVIESCSRRGLKQLTLYTFSTENWLRPLEEVSFLMTLLSRHLRRERENLVKNNIRFQTIGDLDRLPAAVRAEVDATVKATDHCSGMLLTFALSYGGRQDILGAAKALARKVQQGLLQADDINEEVMGAELQTGLLARECGLTFADPDLIIRTSGESRLSNFLLWQSAYSELYIDSVLWPDYSDEDLQKAFDWYAERERRFGKTSAQVDSLKRQGAKLEPSV